MLFEHFHAAIGKCRCGFPALSWALLLVLGGETFSLADQLVRARYIINYLWFV